MISDKFWNWENNFRPKLEKVKPRLIAKKKKKNETGMTRYASQGYVCNLFLENKIEF